MVWPCSCPPLTPCHWVVHADHQRRGILGVQSDWLQAAEGYLTRPPRRRSAGADDARRDVHGVQAYPAAVEAAPPLW